MKAANVNLGGNRFVDCLAPIALRGEALLGFQIEDNRLFVDLNVPAPPAHFAVSVQRNKVVVGPARVEEGASSVTVTTTTGTLVLLATYNGGDVSVVAFDLRPLGLMIWADHALHLGGSVVASNVIQSAEFGIHLT